MPTFKQILKSSAAQKVLVQIISGYIRLVYLTARKRFDVHPLAAPYMRGEDNAIFAFWHGRMMLLPCICPPGRLMHVLISQHRDGLLISEVIATFKQKTISGSTSKNGRNALMTILRLLKNGDNISITPDGPRGPHQIAASGVATAAKLSGKPILPVAFCAKHHKRASSWDRFMLALPFSVIHFSVGEPVHIDRNMVDEDARLLVENSMNATTQHADASLL